ncbi:MAG TPA: MBOAT family O-acyltransferase [Chitinophagaceae bacterium]|nr:MBOAT family O-acyltransferase [Chitinophagaceae bacterium]
MAFIPVYILILGGTIIIDYFAGIWLEKTNGKRKKYFLIASVIANVGVLAVFKYYNFLNENLSVFLSSFGYKNSIPDLSIALPIGLSFHTFQAMSYTIEVYRGNQKAERNFGIYALYVMFYPQLVAGPIERPQNMLHQFYEKHKFVFERVVEGLKLILWGFFMKLVVADRLAIYVNAVYNNPTQHSGLTLAVATVFFAFQIYCDFAGYSNIAIGCAKVMGFKLMTNFNRPYFSASISEFWKRWHISLSTWFKDYLYISLGGNKVSIPRWYFNLFFVFAISGLWHGANWTFIIWGAVNGFYLVFAIVSEKWRNKFGRLIGLNRMPGTNKALQIIITFLLVCFSWIFFRANSVQDAFLIVNKIFSFSGDIYYPNFQQLFYSISAIAILLLIEFRQNYYFKTPLPFKSGYWISEQLAYSALLIITLAIGVFDGGQFIYFQF